MIRIYNAQSFLLLVFLTFTALFAAFKGFNYFYPDNYCEKYSGEVIQYSFEEVDEIKKCTNKLVCVLGESSTQNTDNNLIRKFSCVRRYPPGKLNLW